MDDLNFASVTKMAEAIRQREVSAVELVEAHLERITAVNPQLNAVVVVTSESAMHQAKEADAKLAKGELLGPLHGVPMTLKDSLDTAGVVSTWGTPGRANYVPQADATVVSRLQAAGAILLGKTNTPELTLSYETDNPVYGRSNNPYNLNHSPGGSSGGAAAIIATGGSPFDIGSDTGGSIRLPAHCCGVAGLKPTSGRVPRTGHAISHIGWLNALTQLGPMARYVDDLSTIFPIIAGPDWRDAAIIPMPFANPEAIELRGLRVAVHTDNGIRAAVEPVADVVTAAAKSLETAGAFVEDVRPTGIEETLDILSQLMRGADGGVWVRQILDGAGTRAEDSSLKRYLGMASVNADQMVNQIALWDQFRSKMLAFMANYDLIICPVNAYPALPHGTFAGENYPGFSYTMSYNLTGWPAAVVRCGTSPDGLPIGVQVVAQPWREEVTLAVAKHLENVFGGWKRP